MLLLHIIKKKKKNGVVITYTFRNRARGIKQKQKTKSNDLFNCYIVGTDFQLGTDKNVYEL